MALCDSEKLYVIVGYVSALKNLILLHQDLVENNDASFLTDINAPMLKHILNEDCSVSEQISLYFALAFHHHNVNDNTKGLYFYNLGMSVFAKSSGLIEDQDNVQKLVTENSWNFACIKLTMGDYEGWRLYDHGLRAPAIGAQKWQRALVKPFTNIEIPIWRGESLIGKNILLLEEQAVGDTMMFLTLIPNLIDRASTVGVYLSKRLNYLRYFSHYIQGGKLLVFTKKFSCREAYARFFRLSVCTWIYMSICWHNF